MMLAKEELMAIENMLIDNKVNDYESYKIINRLLLHTKELERKLEVLSCEHEFVYKYESGFECNKCHKKGKRHGNDIM